MGLWQVSSGAFGFAIGFLFVGVLLANVIARRIQIRETSKIFQGTALFLVGSGGGAGLLKLFSEQETIPCYLLGLAAGMFLGSCLAYTMMPPKRVHTRETVLAVLTLHTALPPAKNLDDRAATITMLLDPPTSSQRSSEELGTSADSDLDDIEDESTENDGEEEETES